MSMKNMVRVAAQYIGNDVRRKRGSILRVNVEGRNTVIGNGCLLRGIRLG